MEGLLVCEFQGRVLELRRTSASGVPMGDFSAVYQDTGLAVPGPGPGRPPGRSSLA